MIEKWKAERDGYLSKIEGIMRRYDKMTKSERKDADHKIDLYHCRTELIKTFIADLERQNANSNNQ